LYTFLSVLINAILFYIVCFCCARFSFFSVLVQEFELKFYVQLDIKYIILETFSPGNLLASTEDSKPRDWLGRTSPK